MFHCHPNELTKLCFCVLLTQIISCTRFPESKHTQLNNLNPKALEIMSQPIDDFFPDSPGIDDEDDDLAPIIDKNFYNKISITSTKDMSIIDMLTRLAELANVNMIIAPEIEGKIACSAKNRPFINILQDVCESANLRYTINNDSVKVEYDSPMLKTYNIQFLNIQRDMKSSMATSTDIFTDQMLLGDNHKNNTTTHADNGSSCLVTGNIKADFWDELSKTLTQIVGDDGHISIHKQGGLISVYTTQNKQNAIKKYLKLLKQSIESQVLIEAKILEVSLNDENKGGINWNILRNGGAKLLNDSINQAGLISFGINRTNLEAMVGIIERFGAVKTLSNPRITVLNNQSAILKVVTNEVIGIPSLQKQYATSINNSNFDFISTTLHTIPIGLIMSVIPSIDRKNNTVLLSLRPTVSHILDKKSVPFFYQTSATGGTNTTNYKTQEIPIIDVKEFDSVLKLNSGQVAVMGGLMREESRNERRGLPKASDLDFLFGAREKSTRITELVIFLKATILHKKSHHAADENLYKTFANDPRPLNFKKK